jgi:crotonobetainyl-CoA:carnitine CoA-transferase CaiB-like acyl-CoA transferase
MLLESLLPDGVKVKMPGVVPKLSETPGEVHWQGPALGEHTNAILETLGLSAAEIAALREQGAVS